MHDVVERCARSAQANFLGDLESAEAHWRDKTTRPVWRRVAAGVLKESGHAELAAALQKARSFVADTPTGQAEKLLAEMHAALHKAGAL